MLQLCSAKGQVRPTRDLTLSSQGSAALCAFGGRRLLAFPLEEAIEAGASNAQDLRCTNSIAVAHFEDLLDMNAAHFV